MGKIKNYEKDGIFYQVNYSRTNKLFTCNWANANGIRKGQYHKSNGIPLDKNIFNLIVSQDIFDKTYDKKRELEEDHKNEMKQMLDKYGYKEYNEKYSKEVDNKYNSKKVKVFDELLKNAIGTEEYNKLLNYAINKSIKDYTFSTLERLENYYDFWKASNTLLLCKEEKEDLFNQTQTEFEYFVIDCGLYYNDKEYFIIGKYAI